VYWYVNRFVLASKVTVAVIVTFTLLGGVGQVTVCAGTVPAKHNENSSVSNTVTRIVLRILTSLA